MICSTSYVTVVCDTCKAGLTCGDGPETGAVARFRSFPAARAAVLRVPGWQVLDEGRLRCPECTAAALCRLAGHDFSPSDGSPEDGSFGWRRCACDAAIPGHEVGPWGCEVAFRLCGRCPHIDECPVAELDAPVLARPAVLAVA